MTGKEDEEPRGSNGRAGGVTDGDESNTGDRSVSSSREVPRGAPGEESEERLRALVRGAMSDGAPVPEGVLEGFQRKVRQRSRGKFYDDGWSTSKEPPISTYLVTSLVMLAIVFVVYAVLGPLSGAPARVRPPEPVRIVPPRAVPKSPQPTAAGIPAPPGSGRPLR